jgi:uncharacterized Zn finger protein (UPF0148 family)
MLDLSQLHVQKLADKAKLIKNFEANCACCGAKLPKFPVRSITCPSCSKKSYVENNPVYNKKVLVSEEEKVTLKELDEANKKIYKAIGLTLDEKLLSTGSNDAYWQQLNNSLANQSQSKQSILDTLYQMFLLACHEQNHSLAFERLPAILSLEFGLSVEERLKTDKDFIFISYGRTIFRPYFLQPLLFEDDLPYLEALLTNQEYKARYEYFYNLAGFDGDIIWQCIEAEYKGETTFFEYLHKQVINTPPRADATPKSLLSKIKSKFFN